ncbi:copper chaperone PCu(A)C [Ideonella livida]|uniref:Copper chaperone PCu(A)C n=1 Tax=Ideonella livida TaxID=2707176 RepID=A0A7C9TKK1_9BURK|nr:copper chaperone PCu(A)C [Ideonella livida]NDY91922.1 copper chaperone PCu(A)C [Ideonella livida]
MRSLLTTACLLTALLAPLAASAQTTVKDGWVRGTVAQQKATGAFLQITSAQGGRLVSAASPVAGVVEIHEMKMEGNVMRMAAVPFLELPAGKAVELKPGGFHIMLMALKQALPAGQDVPLTLVVESGGRQETLQLSLPVRPLGAAAAPAGGNAHHGH